MKRRLTTVPGLTLPLTALTLIGTVVNGRTEARRNRDADQSQDFQYFLQTYEAANSALVNGDPEPWLAITVQADPATVFGGFGGPGDEGVTAVRQRYLLAASAFRPSGTTVMVTYLVQHVHQRTAYTVAIESAQVLYAGHSEPQQQLLRTTMIFRLEKDGWKIAHRHADPLVDLHLPETKERSSTTAKL